MEASCWQNFTFRATPQLQQPWCDSFEMVFFYTKFNINIPPKHTFQNKSYNTTNLLGFLDSSAM